MVKANLVVKSKVDLLEMPTEMMKQRWQEEQYISRISPSATHRLTDNLTTSASTRSTGKYVQPLQLNNVNYV
jgi:hypothetical protein